MPDEPIKTLEELRRSFMKPRLPRRLPDTEQNRRDFVRVLTHSHYPRACSRCGKSFLALRGGTVYCSRECQQADRNERRAEKRAAERQRHPRKPIKCARPGCGRSVPPERSTRRYCSDACRQAAYRPTREHRQMIGWQSGGNRR